MRRLLAVALIAGVVIGCDPAPSPSLGAPGAPLQLNFDGRGNPPVIIRINGADVVHVPCLEGATRDLLSGIGPPPPLPWTVEVVRESNGEVLVNQLVASLPQYILVFDNGGGGISSQPALGPASPTCAPT